MIICTIIYNIFFYILSYNLGGPALVNPYSLQAPNYHGYRAPPPPHDSFYHHPAPQGSLALIE